MRVILVPARLRLAAILLFLCVPLVALETVIVMRSPWWRMPYPTIGLWSASVFLLCLPLSIWLMHGKRFALHFTKIFMGSWIFINVLVAIRLRNPTLGFFTLLLMVLFGALVLWLKYELSRSFFDPRLRWYQGLPKPLPGLTCRLSWGDQELACRVGRLDREGAFVFSSASGALVTLRPDGKSVLTFAFRDRSIRCEAYPVRALDHDEGAGFQFSRLAPDLRKQLGDFIETLKGEGYVL